MSIKKQIENWITYLKRLSDNGRYMNISSGMSAGRCFELATTLEKLIEPKDEIQIDEWNGLTDKHKVVLIREAPNWTTLQLIEEVETTLRILNK